MKERQPRSLTVATCFGLLVAIFTLHIAFTSVTNSIAFQELKRWQQKLALALSPLQSKHTGVIQCDRSHKRYDLCSINGTTLLDPTSLTLYKLQPPNFRGPSIVLKTHPYPRKTDKGAMSKVKELTLTSSSPPTSRCGVTHSSPALVFSTGGYTTNFFHAFNEGIIPLFITVNSLFSNRNVTLVITDNRDWWVQKYAELLSQISIHPIINLDNDKEIHCFPSATIGLITHGTMTVNPNWLPKPKTLVDFRAFLSKAYTNGNKPKSSNYHKVRRPQMVLLSRKGSVGRVILNQNQVINAAEEVGFDVVVLKPLINSSLSDAFRLIDRSHVMLGVHGAAMTHSLFLRPKSVLIQVVPIGTEWLSSSCFEFSAKSIGLEYMEYKIGVEESSLVEKYKKNSVVLRNPKNFVSGNWTKQRVYLKDQNVKLDLVKLKKCLKEAYGKAKRFMGKED
ncbi:hypothetical protein FEM48_Zijuj10G0090900 [Ziziphus jujuba var. spinosa]|uniref:Glycosyltransferase 61 catalytic domain-containing protein n=1 Tax=Ziziphus jujuba var. spinosa TaxID=714518 RepID=A0A978UMH4_ZIZJJ|nr:hypothetical protein FEM48_Zijuj10G0090900 [Ziziphus jujuba var. spinosa]